MAQIAEPRRFPESALPAKASDGSHLSWTAFRWNVLAPYRIRILDAVPEERLPTEVIKDAEDKAKHASRPGIQRAQFLAQIAAGRGFGPSPIFPPNLLPAIDDEEKLIRCMLPQCSREALPERARAQRGSMYELPLPRPSLVSGYTLDAFTAGERSELPQSLTATGTVVRYDTGYVSPGIASVAPFLSFEIAKSSGEAEIESAMNRCALNGSWCVRATQLMYNKAYQGFIIPQLPTAFSCTIDNNFAILNHHWIDHGEEYYMAPLRRFNFDDEDEFVSFLAFIKAIEGQALIRDLPRVKAGIERLSLQLTTPPMTPDDSRPDARIHYDRTGSNDILEALKTTFSNLPWRMDEDDRTPMPSSAIKSPMGTRSRAGVFDFSYVDVNSRPAVANFAALRGHRRTESNVSDHSSISSPISPVATKRPPISHCNRPSVPVIRLPASPKERSNSPSSPAPPVQWQQQLMALTQEVQSLRKELRELKTSASPLPSPAVPHILTQPLLEEPGLAPIPEENTSPSKDVVVTVSSSPTSPLKKELTVTVTELPPTAAASPADHHTPSPTIPTTTTMMISQILPLPNLHLHIPRLSFWHIAASIYLAILLWKLVFGNNTQQHREAIACLVFP